MFKRFNPFQSQGSSNSASALSASSFSKINAKDDAGITQAGFICPMCMSSHPSPEELQSHFDEVHAVSDQINQHADVEQDNRRNDEYAKRASNKELESNKEPDDEQSQNQSVGLLTTASIRDLKSQVEMVADVESRQEYDCTSCKSLEQKIVSLDEDKLLLNDEIKRLNVVITELNECNEAITHDSQKTNSKIVQLTTSIEEMEKVISSLKESNSRLSCQNDLLDNTARMQLELELTQLKVKMDALLVEKKQLTHQQLDMEIEMSTSKRDFKNELNVIQIKLLEVENNLIEANVKNEHLSDEKVHYDQQLQEYMVKLDNLVLSQHQAQATITELNTQLSVKSYEIEMLQDQVTSSCAKLEDETTRCKEAAEDAQRLRDERTELIAQMEGGKGEEAAHAQVAEENAMLQKQKHELQQKLLKQAAEHEDKVQQLTSRLQTEHSRAALLDDQLNAATAQMNRVKEEHSANQNRLLQLEDELKLKGELVVSAQAELEQQRADLENQMSLVRRTLADRDKELDKLTGDLAASASAHNEIEDQLKRAIQENAAQVASVNMELEKNKSLLKYSEDQVARLTNEGEKLRQQNILDLKSRKEEVMAAETRHLMKVAALEEDVTRAKEEIEVHRSKLLSEKGDKKATEDELLKVSEECRALSTRHDEIRLQLNRTLTNLEQVQEALAEEIRARKTETENTIRAADEAETRSKELRDQYETLMGENKNLAEEVEKLTAEVSVKDVKLTESERERSSLSARFADLCVTSEQMEAKLRKLEELYNIARQRLTSNDAEIALLRGKVEAGKSEQLNLCDQIDTLNRKVTEGKAEISNLKSMMKAEHDKFQSQVAVLSGEKNEIRNELTNEKRTHQRLVDDLTSQLRMSDDNFTSEKESWCNEREHILADVKMLKTAQHQLIDDKMRIIGQVETLQQQIEEKEKKNASEREELLVEVESFKSKTGQLESKLEVKEKWLETLEADRVVTESRLQLEINTLADNMNTVRAEWVNTSQQLDHVTSENNKLKENIVSFESAAQNNLDERRTLMERCIRSEQNAEQLNIKAGELQAKLEDALSAMHELGRENQALQVKHNTTLTRQWTDDRSSRDCHACGRGFSITVRRHHCRHCGHIFCAECSSRTATVAASKNPVRVCERCYDELTVR